MAIIWKDVVGYEGYYKVSECGEVVSLPREVRTRNASGEILVHRKSRQLKPHLRGNNGKMYPAVTLSRNGKSIAYSLHRLVAEAFIPNPSGLPEVNHKDEDTFNCKASNLEWCSRQYNIEYSKAKRIGQYLDGEKIAEYKSITFASKITGISRTSINNVLAGWSYSAGGYEWKYCENKEGSDDLSHYQENFFQL